MDNGFKFGLEAEYLLADSKEFQALWYKDLSFKKLDTAFQNIDLGDLPSLSGLDAEPPHQKLMPFIVEGYGVVNSDFQVIDAQPKGVEIRTPVCDSLVEVLKVFENCFRKLKKSLIELNLSPIALSHHPIYDKFSGPQNKRRHDFWQWAMMVMSCYGPDINISFPKEISKKLFKDLNDLSAKINYYTPALAALSLNSPIKEGRLWDHRGQKGLGYRTFKRSIVAPPVEYHEDENGRIEFKAFEMTPHLVDFQNYFLLVLTLLLSNDLKGRSSDQERIYDLGRISVLGLKDQETKTRLAEILIQAPLTLANFGYSFDSLSKVENQLSNEFTQAHFTMEVFKRRGLVDVLRYYSDLYTLDSRQKTYHSLSL